MKQGRKVRSRALRWRLSVGVGLAIAGLQAPAWAQTVSPEQELLRQQERERLLREQQESTPDVRLQPATEDLGHLPVEESPCFTINAIALQGDLADRFRWALAAADPRSDPATGRCLGTGGVDVVMKRVQNAIIERGYVTTRILAAPQDLKAGILTLTVVPGRVNAIRFADGKGRTPAPLERDAGDARRGAEPA